MSTVLEIEAAIEKLPSTECNKLLTWFQKYLATSVTSVDSMPHTIGVNTAHQSSEKKLSGFEILGELIGSIKNAPSDLSFNKKYLADYGKESL